MGLYINLCINIAALIIFLGVHFPKNNIWKLKMELLWDTDDPFSASMCLLVNINKYDYLMT